MSETTKCLLLLLGIALMLVMVLKMDVGKDDRTYWNGYRSDIRGVNS